MTEPYVRIWTESRIAPHVHLETDCHCPTNDHEVAMLSAGDYRELMRELESLRSETERLRKAIRNEHFLMNGSSVYMNGPQHERSIRKCQHPLCLMIIDSM